jgi:hypothetical protein
MSITQPECVFVALGIQHAMGMRHIICGLPSFTTLFQFFFIKRHDLKKNSTEHKMCLFSTSFVWNISYSEKKWS